LYDAVAERMESEMSKFKVSMENTRNGNSKTVTVIAADRFEAEVVAEMKFKGFAATDSRLVKAGV
jgi:hypothetical protein